MSFIPKNSNKTQKDKSISRWDRDRRDLDRWDRDRNLADLDRERDRDRNLADFDDRDRRRSARLRSREASIARSRSTPIGAVPIPARSRSWCVGVGGSGAVKAWQSSACVRGLCVWERFRKSIEVKIRTETNFSRFRLIFRSNWKCFQFDRILQHNQTHDFPEIDFWKSISVEPNGA